MNDINTLKQKEVEYSGIEERISTDSRAKMFDALGLNKPFDVKENIDYLEKNISTETLDSVYDNILDGLRGKDDIKNINVTGNQENAVKSLSEKLKSIPGFKKSEMTDEERTDTARDFVQCLKDNLQTSIEKEAKARESKQMKAVKLVSGFGAIAGAVGGFWTAGLTTIIGSGVNLAVKAVDVVKSRKREKQVKIEYIEQFDDAKKQDLAASLRNLILNKQREKSIENSKDLSDPKNRADLEISLIATAKGAPYLMDLESAEAWAASQVKHLAILQETQKETQKHIKDVPKANNFFSKVKNLLGTKGGDKFQRSVDKLMPNNATEIGLITMGTSLLCRVATDSAVAKVIRGGLVAYGAVKGTDAIGALIDRKATKESQAVLNQDVMNIDREIKELLKLDLGDKENVNKLTEQMEKYDRIIKSDFFKNNPDSKVKQKRILIVNGYNLLKSKMKTDKIVFKSKMNKRENRRKWIKRVSIAGATALVMVGLDAIGASAEDAEALANIPSSGGGGGAVNSVVEAVSKTHEQIASDVGTLMTDLNDGTENVVMGLEGADEDTIYRTVEVLVARVAQESGVLDGDVSTWKPEEKAKILNAAANLIHKFSDHAGDTVENFNTQAGESFVNNALRMKEEIPKSVIEEMVRKTFERTDLGTLAEKVKIGEGKFDVAWDKFQEMFNSSKSVGTNITPQAPVIDSTLVLSPVEVDTIPATPPVVSDSISDQASAVGDTVQDTHISKPIKDIIENEPSDQPWVTWQGALATLGLTLGSIGLFTIIKKYKEEKAKDSTYKFTDVIKSEVKSMKSKRKGESSKSYKKEPGIKRSIRKSKELRSYEDIQQEIEYGKKKPFIQKVKDLFDGIFINNYIYRVNVRREKVVEKFVSFKGMMKKDLIQRMDAKKHSEMNRNEVNKGKELERFEEIRIHLEGEKDKKIKEGEKTQEEANQWLEQQMVELTKKIKETQSKYDNLKTSIEESFDNTKTYNIDSLMDEFLIDNLERQDLPFLKNDESGEIDSFEDTDNIDSFVKKIGKKYNQLSERLKRFELIYDNDETGMRGLYNSKEEFLQSVFGREMEVLIEKIDACILILQVYSPSTKLIRRNNVPSTWVDTSVPLKERIDIEYTPFIKQQLDTILITEESKNIFDEISNYERIQIKAEQCQKVFKAFEDRIKEIDEVVARGFLHSDELIKEKAKIYYAIERLEKEATTLQSHYLDKHDDHESGDKLEDSSDESVEDIPFEEVKTEDPSASSLLGSEDTSVSRMTGQAEDGSKETDVGKIITSEEAEKRIENVMRKVKFIKSGHLNLININKVGFKLNGERIKFNGEKWFNITYRPGSDGCIPVILKNNKEALFEALSDGNEKWFNYEGEMEFDFVSTPDDFGTREIRLLDGGGIIYRHEDGSVETQEERAEAENKRKKIENIANNKILEREEANIEKNVLKVISEVINELLINYECVVIPSLGGFIIRSNGKEVSFSNNLKANDGLLINQIAKKIDESYTDAKKIIDEFVSKARMELDEGKKITLEGIGYFIMDNGEIAFIEDREALLKEIEVIITEEPEEVKQTEVTMEIKEDTTSKNDEPEKEKKDRSGLFARIDNTHKQQEVEDLKKRTDEMSAETDEMMKNSQEDIVYGDDEREITPEEKKEPKKGLLGELESNVQEKKNDNTEKQNTEYRIQNTEDRRQKTEEQNTEDRSSITADKQNSDDTKPDNEAEVGKNGNIEPNEEILASENSLTFNQLRGVRLDVVTDGFDEDGGKYNIDNLKIMFATRFSGIDEADVDEDLVEYMLPLIMECDNNEVTRNYIKENKDMFLSVGDDTGLKTVLSGAENKDINLGYLSRVAKKINSDEKYKRILNSII